ncbi:substrate-binding domain-containing protein [Roseateles sp. SL47]|uniref:substrate-binding domain-containing protein n=1 Tax=Roseateles sp. SL47 TaxID=2995138 RepID=UPI00226FD875|nr:substrate-binding domain-containing protein [Roseateles sp. SL47]WAC72459.1 substrate-binding domain-containing protein [Roseateles sp. SL47]
MKSVNLHIGRLHAAVAMALIAVTGAAAAQSVTSGGATLPQPMYQDIITNGPILGTWTYLGTGSGTGKTAFLTNNASLLGKSGTVHIVGSDSALSSAEITTYNAAYNNGSASTVANYGRLVQIPAVATPVLLPYKESGITTLNLSTEELCKIYSFDSGARTWNQVTTVADDGGVGAASPIAVVYRTDNSGTTELLSRFLNQACAPFGKSFTVSNNFKTMVASALPALTAAQDANNDGLPDVWVGGAGSGGVKTAVTANHSLGYLSPEPGYTGEQNAVVARINGFSPNDDAIRSALPAPPATTLARANPINWVPAYTYNASFYPIYGTTNLILGQCYAGGAASGSAAYATKDFVSKLVGGTYDSYITTHNFVKLPAAWLTAIQQTFLTSGASLEINGTACSSVTGR